MALAVMVFCSCSALAQGPTDAIKVDLNFKHDFTTFSLEGAHPHDLTEFANTQGLALRGGHHCTQPLMRKLKVPSTTRASFYFYNTRDEIDRMIDILLGAKKFFGS